MTARRNSNRTMESELPCAIDHGVCGDHCQTGNDRNQLAASQARPECHGGESDAVGNRYGPSHRTAGSGDACSPQVIPDADAPDDRCWEVFLADDLDDEPLPDWGDFWWDEQTPGGD